MKLHLKKVSDKPFVRYFFVAGIIVLIELLTFIFFNTYLDITYLLATPLSNMVAIILNWYFSRTVVFRGKSAHEKHIEFGLVAFASVIGLGLQVLISYVCVDIIGLLPFIGKVVSIVVVFFWSYWIRKKYIFNK